MFCNGKILIGKSGDEEVYIFPKMANRHGMIAGATGTGKTVSLKVMAEAFSDAGVPVFMADVKGDLSGIAAYGEMNDNIQKRIDKLGLDQYDYKMDKYPVTFWDIYGERGLPLRTTISEMGPLLLGRILGLTEVQADILTCIFKIADDEGLLLLDTKDLREMIAYVSENAQQYSMRYGNMTKQSLAAIVRAVIALESEGGEQFFGEPAVDIGRDWFDRENGKGCIQILDCEKLINNPTMYSSFLLWMLSEIYEILPEVGDLDKPKMVFFFDEAHLLFNNATSDLLQKVEQIVKLIRSKGVGVYFITQSPKDIPDGVLAQLGTKIQHALRAYTPAEQKGLKIAADSFRTNPEFDTLTVLQELGTGEALISVLDEKGVPTVVKNCTVLPPQSKIAPVDDSTRDTLIKGSFLYTKYSEYYDRESAYEILTKRIEEAAAEAERRAAEIAEAKAREAEEKAAAKAAEKEAAAAARAAEREAVAAAKAEEKAALAKAKAEEKEALAKKNATKKAVKSVGNSVAGTIGREVGNSIGKTVGGSFGKKLGGNLGASLGRGILSSLLK